MEVDTISYASSFAENISLGLGILIGIIASILVFRAAGKMGGGLFGKVLNLIGTGMLLVVAGTISSLTLSSFIPATFLSLINTVLFSAGYICMVLGANKLLKGIMS